VCRFAHRLIDVTVAELDDGGIVVRVSDDGPGLAPEDQEPAFERFVPLVRELGAGLTLSLVRGIASGRPTLSRAFY
jgi:signal transduction histidine kinase